ncbi:GNAT family N-acetyltransferase [Planococcus sp. CP5-4]|nr:MULTISPECIES: GNAT family N-acetyltransferase [unclassified Planococcus (in: firmicutes)]MBU9674493.1 GNAT family N-acetyltransferase [Planococcus sp. CP5-4_YE]MBV0910124.1 GNAT family N-acetyltransferase [Planococcus sp. CP5-4_UN]MBW6064669.1 GNAT family N-acetyltransferase [Planococcus sp. CP5-4]
MDSSVKTLLSYATSSTKVKAEYEKYFSLPNFKLYGMAVDEKFFACIGIEFLEKDVCEIRHLSVSSEIRGQNIGSEMIDFICRFYPFHQIIAETDQQAVEFYRKYGFSISSLGEKYPGVERFRCVYQVKR